MPAHPVSRLVRFTLAVGTNVIFDHLGYRRPTAHPVRVIEAVELPATSSTSPSETRQRITFGDVERYPAAGCVIPATVAVAAVGWRPG